MDEGGVDYPGISNRHRFQSILARASTDIDPEITEFDRLGPVIRLKQVGRFAPDNADHWLAGGHESDTLPNEHLGIPTANLVEPDEAVVVNMGDLETDLVDVTLDEDRGRMR